MKIAYGSSCMGQQPTLVHKVGEPQGKSYSYMYAMVKMDADQYIFAGSLSWRIFITHHYTRGKRLCHSFQRRQGNSLNLERPSIMNKSF
jgi:hypothetical protein